MEYWDLYDENEQPTGEVWQREWGNFRDVTQGRYHLVVDILLQAADGEYLLTKRHPDKDVYPGYWEASAGGSVLKGEGPLEGAKRELQEETGMVADTWEEISVTRKDSSHAIYHSYLAKTSQDKDSVRLQEGETTDYKWVDARGLLDYVHSESAIQSHNLRYATYLKELEEKLKTS